MVYTLRLNGATIVEDRMSHISVLIVDDHPLFRQGLRDVLSTERDLRVVGEAENGEQALDLAQTLRPNVILMDINLPGMNGLLATKRLRSVLPEVRVIMLTGYDDPEQRLHAIHAGAAGYCAKEIMPEQLVEAVRQAMKGQYFVSGQVMDEAQLMRWVNEQVRQGHRLSGEDEPFRTLSERETEILMLVTRGLSNKEIAYELGISHQTVKNHMTKILQKLELLDRTQAAVYALSRGWVRLREQQDDQEQAHA
jgi:DNA-binding NarL/FixJ family response regulator